MLGEGFSPTQASHPLFFGDRDECSTPVQCQTGPDRIPDVIEDFRCLAVRAEWPGSAITEGTSGQKRCASSAPTYQLVGWATGLQPSRKPEEDHVFGVCRLCVAADPQVCCS